MSETTNTEDDTKKKFDDAFENETTNTEDDTEKKFDDAFANRLNDELEIAEGEDLIEYKDTYQERIARRKERQEQAAKLLADNPIFQRTSTTLERIQQGKSALTVEEFQARYFDLNHEEISKFNDDFIKNKLMADDSVEDEHAQEYAKNNPDNVVAYRNR